MSQTAVATTLTRAFAGMLSDGGPHDIVTAYNDEASLEMPFGACVTLQTAERAAKLPAAGSDKLMGLVVHEHGFSKGPADAQLGSTGLKGDVLFGVLRKGKMWVTVENGCAIGDRMHVRYAAGAGGSQLGAIRSASVNNETIDATTQGVFLSVAATGGIAIVDVDFTSKP